MRRWVNTLAIVKQVGGWRGGWVGTASAANSMLALLFASKGVKIESAGERILNWNPFHVGVDGDVVCSGGLRCGLAAACGGERAARFKA